MGQAGIGPLRAVVITMAFCSLGLLFWLTTNYQNTRPTTPNELVGAVYPLDEHGRFVYLTAAEHQKIIASQACCYALLACYIAVEIRYRRQRRAKDQNAPIHPE